MAASLPPIINTWYEKLFELIAGQFSDRGQLSSSQEYVGELMVLKPETWWFLAFSDTVSEANTKFDHRQPLQNS